MLWELSLDVNTLCVENKQLLSPMSIKSWSGSKEGSGDQQMMPKLLNKALSVKAT